LCRSPKATNIIALPLAEGDEQSSGQLFVAFSDGMFFTADPAILAGL
jgi:hypothetical protein